MAEPEPEPEEERAEPDGELVEEAVAEAVAEGAVEAVADGAGDEGSAVEARRRRPDPRVRIATAAGETAEETAAPAEPAPIPEGELFRALARQLRAEPGHPTRSRAQALLRQAIGAEAAAEAGPRFAAQLARWGLGPIALPEDVRVDVQHPEGDPSYRESAKARTVVELRPPGGRWIPPAILAAIALAVATGGTLHGIVYGLGFAALAVLAHVSLRGRATDAARVEVDAEALHVTAPTPAKVPREELRWIALREEGGLWEVLAVTDEGALSLASGQRREEAHGFAQALEDSLDL